MDSYQQYIAVSRYARYREDLKRRETWPETVERYLSYWNHFITNEEKEELRNAIVNLEVMPSMRGLMSAGPALDRDNVAGYNCAYLTISRMRAFDEMMYILMCGTGCGFSVERQYIAKLPEVADEFHDTDTTIYVRDSKIGWSKALREVIGLLYAGQIPAWDLSKIRPAGAPLKTFGGRASGPEPLNKLFKHLVEIFRNARGRRLNSLECHDICCHIADSVVVGGVRRSALISLSNLSDGRMSTAKSGQWWHDNPQRYLANNSVCYTEYPDVGAFMKEWVNLYESKSGERGIFSRKAATEQVRRGGRRDPEHEFGTNPCSEIILRDRQFCNLTEVIARPSDTQLVLKSKVRTAAILGTLQSTLTDFRYLSPKWKENCEEERLLGVSLTGIMDHPVLNGAEDLFLTGEWLQELKQVAIDTNKEWAKRLGINQSTAITCVKPSGTVSQLCNTASGIHPRHSQYYIRRVRNDIKDPLAKHLQGEGIPWEPDKANTGAVVFSFPQKAPHGALLRVDVSALDQLNLWKVYAEHWCEHKPSITVSVREHEWMEVGAWVYNNFSLMSGVSFLPYSDHTYEQAPYEEITEEEYNRLLDMFPLLERFSFDEEEDSTTSSQELACVAGLCEV
jgi:ribonucleoside-diphosphate reductase alpha chain